MIGAFSLLEYLDVLPHYHLEGFVGADLYKNILFLGGGGFIFLLTSVLIVNLTHLIITKSVKIEETYVKTNLELDNKDKLRNEYVLRVTHDIKGHLGAIFSCLEVVRSGIAGPLNDQQQEFVNRAGERTQLLSTFIKDLLNLTRKRLQKDQEFEEVSLQVIIEKVLANAQILAHDKSIQINSFIDKNIGPIIGNPFALEELYSNLLLNAIKYTPAKGHIELNIRNRFDHVLNEISDSGIGIPKEDLPKVFDEFFRAGNAPKDTKSGSGLGLSIVKQIVEVHKGRIWVSSELGIWTRFTFTLPKNPNLVV
jgi:signal transduction histidine kinase